MKIGAPSFLSNALGALGRAAGEVGEEIYEASGQAEQAIHNALAAPSQDKRSAVAFLAGAVEGLVDVPLDLARVGGALLSGADPSKLYLAARFGLPLMRAFEAPGSVFTEVRDQWGKDFAREPARVLGYSLTNPLGELARLDDESTFGPGVRFLSAPVPGTHRSLPVIVYTPPGVKNTKDIPVVYYLHGTPGEPGDFLRDGGKAALDRWFKEGHAPFIFAEPDGDVPGRADSEWLNSADGNPDTQVESYLMSAVIPAVEGDQLRDRKKRLILGYSMGAYGAMNLALHHPDKFGGVASLEGYYHVDDTNGMLVTPQDPNGPPEIQDPGGPGLADPSVVKWNSPDQNVDRARGLGVLLIGGKSDQGVSRGETERMAEVFNRHGIPNTMLMVPGGHMPSTLSSQMRTFFEWIESQA